MSRIDKLGLGCDRLGSFSGIGKVEAAALLTLAYDKGIRFYDTANIYGQGVSEVLLGEMANRAEGVSVSTKGGYRGASPSGVASSGGIKRILRPILKRVKLVKTLVMRVRSKVVSGQAFSTEEILKAAGESKVRLGCEIIDLYLLHSPPRDLLSSGDSLLALLKVLKSEHLVSKCGLAVKSIGDLAVLECFDGIDHIQVELNLMSLADDFDVMRAIKEAHPTIEIAVRRPYSGGLLFGGDDSVSPRQERLSVLAAANDLELDELCLGYMLQCQFVDRVLVGTTKQPNLLRNVKIAKEIELDEKLVGEIEKALADTTS